MLVLLHCFQKYLCSVSSPEIIKLFMLNSTEHEIYPAHKCFFLFVFLLFIILF